jgi:cytochrome c-type biogenesis protein CcmH/NrfF
MTVAAALLWALKVLAVLLAVLIVAASVLLGFEWRESVAEDAEAERRRGDQGWSGEL